VQSNHVSVRHERLQRHAAHRQSDADDDRDRESSATAEGWRGRDAAAPDGQRRNDRDGHRRQRSGGGGDIQREVGEYFMRYGLPLLKDYGPKLLKQGQEFLAARHGGGG